LLECLVLEYFVRETESMSPFHELKAVAHSGISPTDLNVVVETEHFPLYAKLRLTRNGVDV
jgi:hypothetical protein